MAHKGAIQTRRVAKVAGATATHFDDDISVEEPLEIRVREGSGVETPLSVTMRTPGDDRALAMGFLFTEGIIPGQDAVNRIDHCQDVPADAAGNVIRVEFSSDFTFDKQKFTRHFYTTSSCGVCGKTSLEAVAANTQYPIEPDTFRIDLATLTTLGDELHQQQTGFRHTGGLHAAGLFDEQGTLIKVCEDVGRHNALDKLVGHALANDMVPLSEFGLLFSGRASFELLQKAWMAGCPFVAAVGAPSSLAIELAESASMTLIGFLSAGSLNVYCGEQRIADPLS